MRYAVMSDVHANPRALEVALADARAQDCGRFVMLGDTTGYGYDAPGALRLVRKSFNLVLMGNHDSACLGLEPVLETLVNKNYALDVAQRELLPKTGKMWLRSRKLTKSEGDCAFVHGDFTCPGDWRYVFDDPEALACLRACDARVLFCGHTHHAAVWQMSGKGALRRLFASEFGDPPLEPESFEFVLPEDGRAVVNVGSVGYPRNDLCASYATYDDKTRRICVRRLPFDFKSYVADMESAGVRLPLWLRDLLAKRG